MESSSQNKNILADKSTWSLLIANLIVIVLALSQKWNLINLLWVYWMQSIFIGYFQFRKMLDLKNFKSDNFYINGRLVPPTDQTKKFVARFFLLHYGIFHFVYFIFLLTDDAKVNFGSLVLPAIGFLINHYFSYKRNKEVDSNKPHQLGQMMFAPYARIIPMHIIIVLGKLLASSISLLFFLLLKTGADLLSHYLEHRSSSPPYLEHSGQEDAPPLETI